MIGALTIAATDAPPPPGPSLARPAASVPDGRFMLLFDEAIADQTGRIGAGVPVGTNAAVALQAAVGDDVKDAAEGAVAGTGDEAVAAASQLWRLTLADASALKASPESSAGKGASRKGTAAVGVGSGAAEGDVSTGVAPQVAADVPVNAMAVITLPVPVEPSAATHGAEPSVVAPQVPPSLDPSQPALLEVVPKEALEAVTGTAQEAVQGTVLGAVQGAARPGEAGRIPGSVGSPGVASTAGGWRLTHVDVRQSEAAPQGKALDQTAPAGDAGPGASTVAEAAAFARESAAAPGGRESVSAPDRYAPGPRTGSAVVSQTPTDRTAFTEHPRVPVDAEARVVETFAAATAPSVDRAAATQRRGDSTGGGAAPGSPSQNAPQIVPTASPTGGGAGSGSGGGDPHSGSGQQRPEGPVRLAGVGGAVPVAQTVEPGAPAAPLAPVVQAAEALPSGTAERVIDQIVQSMHMQVRNGIGEAIVRLNPEHLGEVTISLRVEHGVVSATMEASLPAVRQWLESQEATVRQGLAQQGLQLERFVVSRDGQARQDQQPDPRQAPRRRVVQEDDLERPRFEISV